MTLLDTMVVVYARTPDSPYHQWAKAQIAGAVAGSGAAINAVSLAELCAEEGMEAAEVAHHIAGFGIEILDVPASAAARCGEAYRKYRRQRKRESGKDSPKVPLPDFFIGAHAEIMGWELATNDSRRFQSYFSLKLVTP
jgi:predicted nucleic acid-binding protein